MIYEGIKLTYRMGEIEGARESYLFEVGDIVWRYQISESYRKQHPGLYKRSKCKIIEVSKSSDGKHFESYGVEDIETGEREWWYYPTFLEPFTEQS